MIIINIATEYTKTPGGRYKKNGNFSGEDFRERFLDRFFVDTSSNEKIQIFLDGTYGYPTSFLEEAFGGLARLYGKKKVKERLTFVSKEEPLLIEEIMTYINSAKE